MLFNRHFIKVAICLNYGHFQLTNVRSSCHHIKMPVFRDVGFKRSSLTSLRSPTSTEAPPSSAVAEDARSLRTFSPEPVAAAVRIPPVISEHEAFQVAKSIDFMFALVSAVLT